jgi:glucose-6-phosphate dehydrogenase assembly protein OpcA
MDIQGAARAIFSDNQRLEIDLQELQATLRRLWNKEDQGQRQFMRACVMNFVIIANNDEQAAMASDIIATLTTSHPCRAIILIADAAAEEAELRAWLSAHCQAPSSSGQRVCCEQITVRAAGDAIETLPSAVLSLLVPDLPVVLWWVDEPPFGAPSFEQLVRAADRLIVDTMRFDDPTFSLTRLAALIRANGDRIAVSDLNWARLTVWQEHIAQFFDSIDTLPYLERLDRITIRYARLPGGGRVDPEQALLLVGWLLSRLGWKMPPALARVSSGHFRGRLRRAGRELTIEITPEECQAGASHEFASGMLIGVELRAASEAQPAVFRVERASIEDDMVTATIAMGEGEPLVRTSRLLRPDLASLLAEDLTHFDNDYLFEAALETAAHLSGAAQLLSR